MSATKAPVRVGIVGCGQIAHEYAATIAASGTATVVACADASPGAAVQFAERHGIGRVLIVDDLLDPDVVDIAVMLTPPHTHATLAHRAIAARLPGVWVEKPLASSHDDAQRLLAAADQAGTLLAAAPDTVLGAPTRTAHAAISEGLIGEVLGASAAYLSAGPERWHPAPEPFHAAGIGPLADMGPYYLASLIRLLGPIASVTASSCLTRPTRTIATGPRAGATFTAHAPTHVTALLSTRAGVPVTFVASFDSAGSKSPHLEIHGTAGTLLLPDPNFHDGDVLLRAAGRRDWTTLDPRPGAGLSRGAGVLELAAAVSDGGELVCSGQAAAHVTAVIDTIAQAAIGPTRAVPSDHPFERTSVPGVAR